MFIKTIAILEKYRHVNRLTDETNLYSKQTDLFSHEKSIDLERINKKFSFLAKMSAKKYIKMHLLGAFSFCIKWKVK